MLALILIVGGLGAAAFHPPAAALAHRLGGERPGFSMSVYITGGTLGFCLGPLMFAPFAQHFGLAWTPLLALPGLVVVAFFLTRVPPMPLHPSSSGGFRTLRPYARPLGLLYVIVVLRTLTAISFCDVPAGHARAARPERQPGRNRRRHLSVRQRTRRILRRTGGRSSLARKR